MWEDNLSLATLSDCDDWDEKWTKLGDRNAAEWSSWDEKASNQGVDENKEGGDANDDNDVYADDAGYDMNHSWVVVDQFQAIKQFKK